MPGDRGSGILDPTLTSYLKANDFEVGNSPIGGVWDVEINKSSVTCAVGVHLPTVPNRQLQQIAALIDDGDTANGQLRFLSGDRFYWMIIE